MFDFLSGVGDFLGGVATAIGEAVTYLFSVMLYLFNLILQLLSAVAQFFAQMLKAIGAFFKHLWENFFKGILQDIWKHIRNAWQWLHDKLGPAFKWLQQLRDRLDRWYRMYVVPYLNMLQRVRGYLHILALLHVKFAQELDAKIAQIQAQIVQAFATVRASLNAVIDIGNAIVDPAYLLRKPQLLLSIRRQIPALIRAVTGRPPGYWFPSPKGAAGGAFAPVLPFVTASGAIGGPTASDLLAADDGLLDTSSFFDGTQYMAGAVDQIAPLDYFDNTLYPESLCPNGASSCLISTWS
jgi:hypothetical protein